VLFVECSMLLSGGALSIATDEGMLAFSRIFTIRTLAHAGNSTTKKMTTKSSTKPGDEMKGQGPAPLEALSVIDASLPVNVVHEDGTIVGRAIIVESKGLTYDSGVFEASSDRAAATWRGVAVAPGSVVVRVLSVVADKDAPLAVVDSQRKGATTVQAWWRAIKSEHKRPPFCNESTTLVWPLRNIKAVHEREKSSPVDAAKAESAAPKVAKKPKKRERSAEEQKVAEAATTLRLMAAVGVAAELVNPSIVKCLLPFCVGGSRNVKLSRAHNLQNFTGVHFPKCLAKQLELSKQPAAGLSKCVSSGACILQPARASHHLSPPHTGERRRGRLWKQLRQMQKRDCGPICSTPPLRG